MESAQYSTFKTMDGLCFNKRPNTLYYFPITHVPVNYYFNRDPNIVAVTIVSNTLVYNNAVDLSDKLWLCITSTPIKIVLIVIFVTFITTRFPQTKESDLNVVNTSWLNDSSALDSNDLYF